MPKHTSLSAEELLPENFFDSIESCCAELTIRLQMEGDDWRERTDLGPTFQKIAAQLEEATGLLPERAEG